MIAREEGLVTVVTQLLSYTPPPATLCPLNMHRASALNWAQIWAEGC